MHEDLLCCKGKVCHKVLLWGWKEVRASPWVFQSHKLLLSSSEAQKSSNPNKIMSLSWKCWSSAGKDKLTRRPLDHQGRPGAVSTKVAGGAGLGRGPEGRLGGVGSAEKVGQPQQRHVTRRPWELGVDGDTGCLGWPACPVPVSSKLQTRRALSPNPAHVCPVKWCQSFKSEHL